MRDVAVLIVADADDPHTRLVLSLLSQKDVLALALNLGNLRGMPLSMQHSQLRIGSDPVTDSRCVGRGTTVWWHRAGTTPVEGLDRDEAMLVADENPHLLKGALDACGVRWVDPPHIVARAEAKLYQLSIADQLGIPTPDTLVTNTPEEARRLQAGRRLVTKPLSPGFGIAIHRRSGYSGPSDVNYEPYACSGVGGRNG